MTDHQNSSAGSDGCLSAEDREALDQVYISHLKKEIERLRDVAQSAAVSPGVIERMVTGAWDDARAQAIEECAKICEGGEWTRYATNHSPTKSCAIAIRALASQPSPAATVETEEWAEVTDGTTKEGDRFSYISNTETGVGEITSHRRRVQRSSAVSDLADWSSLPRDLYVTSVKSDGIVFEVTCCSVPMAIGPEVRYSQVVLNEPQAAPEIQNAGNEAAISDIPWAVNYLLEQIAAKFEAWDSFDLFRSEAAATVRSFKQRNVGSDVAISDNSAHAEPQTLSKPEDK